MTIIMKRATYMSVGAHARVPHATARTPLIQQHAHGAQLVDHSTWGKAFTPSLTLITNPHLSGTNKMNNKKN